jgi:cytochrome c
MSRLNVFLFVGFTALAAALVPATAQVGPAPALAILGDAEAGAELYSAECRGCHAVSIAPTLRGVIGRRIASVAEFFGYSDGLKSRSGETWSESNLDAFLTAPSAFVPGTLMVKALPDAQQRADVIAYIATLPPPRQ